MGVVGIKRYVVDPIRVTTKTPLGKAEASEINLPKNSKLNADGTITIKSENPTHRGLEITFTKEEVAALEGLKGTARDAKVQDLLVNKVTDKNNSHKLPDSYVLDDNLKYKPEALKSLQKDFKLDNPN